MQFLEQWPSLVLTRCSSVAPRRKRFSSWDLTNRQCKWTALCETGLYPGTAVAGGSKVLAGYMIPQAMGCRDGSGGLVSRCCSDRDELCAFNPRTGDYIAGYSRHNYTFRSGLGGAVRIWNASGDRLTTFAAHRGNNWPTSMDGSLYERRVSRHSRSKDSQGLGFVSCVTDEQSEETPIVHAFFRNP